MTARRPRICVVGSSNMDVTVRTPRLPREGETLAAHSFALGCGGKGGNQAVMAARLGAEVVLVSRVGNDSFAELLLASYEREGVDTHAVSRDPERLTGMATILVDDLARNCILVVGGANAGLTAELVAQARDDLIHADMVLCQLEIPLAAVLESFSLARSAGIPTLLNPAPAQDLPNEVFQHVDICVPNESELETLTGTACSDLAQAEGAARELLSRGPRLVIVTLGSQGMLVVEHEKTTHIPVMKVRAIDPTGAGDAFIGSLAVFLAEKCPLHEAVAQAGIAAALTVTRAGTHQAFPFRAEMETHWKHGTAIAGVEEQKL